MKNQNVTSFDNGQIAKRTYEEAFDAQRVFVVGQTFNIDSDRIINSIKEGLKQNKVEVTKEKEVPKWHKICIIMQTVALLGLLISHILK